MKFIKDSIRFIVLILELSKYWKNLFLCVYNMRMDGKDQTKCYSILTTSALHLSLTFRVSQGSHAHQFHKRLPLSRQKWTGWAALNEVLFYVLCILISPWLTCPKSVRPSGASDSSLNMGIFLMLPTCPVSEYMKILVHLFIT